MVASLVRLDDHSQTHPAAGVDIGIEASAASIGCSSSHRRCLSRILFNVAESEWLKDERAMFPRWRLTFRELESKLESISITVGRSRRMVGAPTSKRPNS